jgi:hypothetical protein
MEWFKRRLCEPSTWAGIAAIMAAVGQPMLADATISMANVIIGIMGGAAVVMPEKK